MIWPRWSADGEKLVGGVRAEERFVSGILLYTIATDQIELVRETGTEPDFLPDCRIAFRDHVGDVFVLDLSTGAETRVEMGELAYDVRLIMSADGRSLWGQSMTSESDVWVLTSVDENPP